MGQQAARGVFWTVLFSLLNKVVAMASQVGIAWFLSPNDIGLVATATSVVGILSMLMGGQLQRVLIQRQRTFDDDAGQVFWLSVCMNLLAAVGIAVSASFLSRSFGDPRLKELLWIIAAAIPLMAIPVVYGAKLFIELRFGLMSGLSFGEGIIRNAGGFILAAAGLGPKSLVIPFFFSALLASIAQRRFAGRLAFGHPRPREWKTLVAPAFWLILIASLASGVGYGTNLIIAASRQLEVAGLYYWGFSMSAQASFLIVTSLQSVLFPVFASMGDTLVRQRAAFERTMAALIMVVVPVTLLQVFLAQPAVSMLFHARWLPAVPVIQWLSLGVLTQPLVVVGGALLMARGEYRKLALANALMAACTFGAAFVGTRLGREREIAQWVGTASLVSNLFPGWLAYRLLGGTGEGLWKPFTCALSPGLPVALIGVVLNGLGAGLSPVPHIVLVTAGVTIPYCGLVYRFCPELARTMLSRVRDLRNRL